MNKVDRWILNAFRRFAVAVTKKMEGLAAGEPEDQLRAPFEVLMKEVGDAIGREVVAKGESRLAGRLGQPDYAILTDKLLAGYAELKAPGVGARPSSFRGHDRRQWERFRSLPNLLYSDGNEWSLHRNGVEVRPLVQLLGDISVDGASAVRDEDAELLRPLLTDFLFWEPIVPSDAKELAAFVAPVCRLLRDEVLEALDTSSPLKELAKDWRQLLFPDASDAQFADAYAQTVIFGLLLARSEGAGTLDLASSIASLAAKHTLLSKALQVLTDPQVRAEIGPSLALAQRIIDRVPISTMTIGKTDPWLYFYELFLAAYDPDLRRDAGAYYTPVEVVRCQVRLLHDLLTARLDKARGFADEMVVTLDPGVGTGTYLLGVIEHALQEIAEAEGVGSVPGRATILARNLYGFEIMVGPYAVAELRVTRTLKDRGASLSESGPHIYLTDTLESPHTTPPQFPLILREMADQHKRALHVKKNVPVIVCPGNPPYDRHERADSDNKSRTGGWVRYGDIGSKEPPILEYFTKPVKEAGHGGDLKNLYNLYVYFWRWALWKVFEQKSDSGPGIVSFISAASYLDGDAFVGMREHLRHICDDIWIIDLGGEGRGTRQSDNVFAIKTPVAIGIAARYAEPKVDVPASVHYSVIEGTRSEKLSRLDGVKALRDLQWEDCATGWHAPFRPAGAGHFFTWPKLTDVFPWQHSGVQLKRTWPIAPDPGALGKRWRALLTAGDRAAAFRETDDRRIGVSYQIKLTPTASVSPIALLPNDAPVPPIVRYAYRSFDPQYLIADGRLISRPRPPLWESHSDEQVYLTSLFSQPLGRGPAATVSAYIPDLDHFRGSYGAKATIPLWLDASAASANVNPGLLHTLEQHLGIRVRAQDFFSYVYGILAHSGFTDQFARQLEKREVRIPITKSPSVFKEVAAIGRRLICLHTYGERLKPTEKKALPLPRGRTRCTKAVSDDPKRYPQAFSYARRTQILTIGTGEFRPVAPEVWDFEVSGLKVLQSWLGYRMKNRRGRHSSPLDSICPNAWTAQFTTELLRVTWVLETTLAEYPRQAELLQAVINGPVFTECDLPEVPEGARKAPEIGASANLQHVLEL